MADIRINSLPTTASASSSNDFLAIDGATNGTRKLSAYSPTFGGAVTINGNGTYGAIQLPSGTTSIYGVAFGTDTNLWRTDSGNLELGGSSVALIGLNVGGTNKGYFYNNGTDTTLAGAGTLTFKSNGTTTGLTLDSSNATVAGNLTVSGAGTSSVAGNLNIGEPTGSGYRLYVKAGFGLALGGSYIECGEYDKPCSILNHTNPAVSANLFQIQKQGSGVFTVSSAGNLGIGTTSPVTTLNVVKTLGSSGTIANSLLHLGSAGSLGNIYPITFGYSGSSAVNPPAFLGMEITDSNSYTKGALVFGLRDVTTDTLPTERARITSSGNVLIGTTTDTGNGKLQLATHTTSAGGIGFGTDTSLYRQAAGALSIDHIGGSVPVLNLSENGTIKAILQTSSGNVYLGAINTAGASLFLRSGNNTTALTLDSSQNATFAGTSVTVDGASTGSTLTLKRASNANGAIISYKTTTTSKWYHGLRGLVDDNWYLQNDVAGNTALFFDASTSNATFAGTVTGTQFKSASGTTSAADGVATTVLSLSGKSGQMYLVHASLSGVNDAGNYAAFATVVMDGTSARIVSNNGTYMTLTLSGTNVQATQTSGVTQTIVYKYTSV